MKLLVTTAFILLCLLSSSSLFAQKEIVVFESYGDYVNNTGVVYDSYEGYIHLMGNVSLLFHDGKKKGSYQLQKDVGFYSSQYPI